MNCFKITSDGFIKESNSSDCNFVILSNVEYQQYSQPLEINPEIYTTVSGWILFSFVSGHVLGRILKALGKS